MSNSTDYEHDEDIGVYSPAKLALRATFSSITSVLSISSNAICLMVLPRVRNIPENNRLFLLSLTISGFGTGVGAFIYIAPAAYGQWIYSDAFCVFVSVIMAVFSFVSIISLICLTVDKYIAIMKPLRYSQLITRRRVIAVIIVTWVLCAIDITCFYSPIISGLPVSYRVSAAACTPELTSSDSLSFLHTILIGIITILLPLASISFIYIHLYRIIRKQIHELQSRLAQSQDDCNRKSTLTGEGKVIRLFAAITVTYIIVWTPYFIAITYTNITMNIIPWLDFMGNWLVISGSWCDAAILAGMSSAFRKVARMVFAKCAQQTAVIFRRKRTAPMMNGTNADIYNTSGGTLHVTELEPIDT